MLQSIKSRLDKHFVACSAVAAAAAVVGVHQQSADAAIIHSGVVNIPIAATTNGLYLNMVTGAINEPGNTGGATVPGWDINPWSSTGFGLFNPAAPAGGVYVSSAPFNAANMVPGALISAANTFSSNTSSNTSQWALNSSNTLIGVRFQNEANANQVHYGWFRVAFGATVTQRTLVEYAYEDVAGAGINAGAVPAPGSLALLALGGLGLAGRRRK